MMGLGNVMQSVGASPFRGKTVRISGWIRTDGKPESKASLWLKKGRDYFDNSQDRAVG